MTEPVMLRFVVTQDARDLLGVLEEYVDWKRQRIQDMLDWPEEPETEEAETVALAALEVAMSMSNRLANQLAFRDRPLKTEVEEDQRSQDLVDLLVALEHDHSIPHGHRDDDDEEVHDD